MSDLIEKRDERTRKRKRMKRKMDSIIGLSFHDNDKKVMSLSMDLRKLSDGNEGRGIDEGYIDNGFVIKKGALEKYVNGKNELVRGWEFNGEEWEQTEVLNLTSDFVGTVNLGHFDFAQMPFILGEWTQSDLTLVDIENGRKALDVNLHLDEESVFIKELKRQPHEVGISAEFWVHQNEEDTENLSEMFGYYLPVYDEIFIFAYGIVGECGNVNSSGFNLKGEPMEKLKDIIIEETLDEEKELGVEEVELPTDEPKDEPIEETAEEAVAEDNEPAEDEVADEAEESDEESEESEEVVDEEVAEEEDEEVDDDEAEDAEEEELSIVNELREQIQTLTNKINELAEANAKLKKTNRKLSSKYQNELDKKAKFKEELKGLSVELLPDEDKKPKEEKIKVMDRNYVRDGIGEL